MTLYLYNVAKCYTKKVSLIPKKYWTTFTRAGSYGRMLTIRRSTVARGVVSAHSSREFHYMVKPQVCDVQHLLPDPYLVGAGYMKSYKGDS